MDHPSYKQILDFVEEFETCIVKLFSVRVLNEIYLFLGTFVGHIYGGSQLLLSKLVCEVLRRVWNEHGAIV